MRILAFESSAKAASVALLEDGRLLGASYLNNGQTHSRTLLKLAEDLLTGCDLRPADVDAVAWANGPGSFTGVRIGAAAAKGFCWGGALLCAPVSTLEAMAWQAARTDCTVCACMDARRSQVYNALFRYSDGAPVRLCPDRAISVAELAAELAALDGPILLVGDGAQLCYDALGPTLPQLRLAPEHQRQQRAEGVALAAWQAAQTGSLDTARDAVPNYLRLSQAERERLEKQGK